MFVLAKQEVAKHKLHPSMESNSIDYFVYSMCLALLAYSFELKEIIIFRTRFLRNYVFPDPLVPATKSC